MDLPRDLVDLHTSGKLVPFLGGGVSRAVLRRNTERPLFPGLPDLLGEAAEILDDRVAARVRRLLAAATPDYSEIARLVQENLTSPRWRRFLRERLDLDYSEAEPASLALTTAVWQLDPDIVVTTTVDRALLWGCPEHKKRDLRVVSLEAGVEFSTINTASRARPVLWHLHGRSESPGTLLLTPDSHDRLHRDPGGGTTYQEAIFALRNLAASRSFLFVGWEPSDEVVLDHLIRVQQVLTKSENEHYVLCLEEQVPGMRQVLSDRGFEARLVAVERGGSLVDTLRTLRRAAKPHRQIPTQGDPMAQLPLRRRCKTVPADLPEVNPRLVAAFSDARTVQDLPALLHAARHAPSSLTIALAQAEVLEFEGAIELMAIELGQVTFLGLEEGYRRLYRGIAFEKLGRLEDAIADYNWIERNIDEPELRLCAAFNTMICREKANEDVSFREWLDTSLPPTRLGDLVWTKAVNLELVAAVRRGRRLDYDVDPLVAAALDAERTLAPAGYARTLINSALYHGTAMTEDVLYEVMQIANVQPVNTATGLLHHCLDAATRLGDERLRALIERDMEFAYQRSRASATVERFR